jgi:hypothetical protein
MQHEPEAGQQRLGNLKDGMNRGNEKCLEHEPEPQKYCEKQEEAEWVEEVSAQGMTRVMRELKMECYETR